MQGTPYENHVFHRPGTSKDPPCGGGGPGCSGQGLGMRMVCAVVCASERIVKVSSCWFGAAWAGGVAVGVGGGGLSVKMWSVSVDDPCDTNHARSSRETPWSAPRHMGWPDKPGLLRNSTCYSSSSVPQNNPLSYHTNIVRFVGCFFLLVCAAAAKSK